MLLNHDWRTLICIIILVNSLTASSLSTVSRFFVFCCCRLQRLIDGKPEKECKKKKPHCSLQFVIACFSIQGIESTVLLLFFAATMAAPQNRRVPHVSEM